MVCRPVRRTTRRWQPSDRHERGTGLRLGLPHAGALRPASASRGIRHSCRPRPGPTHGLRGTTGRRHRGPGPAEGDGHRALSGLWCLARNAGCYGYAGRTTAFTRYRARRTGAERTHSRRPERDLRAGPGAGTGAGSGDGGDVVALELPLQPARGNAGLSTRAQLSAAGRRIIPAGPAITGLTLDRRIPWIQRSSARVAACAEQSV